MNAQGRVTVEITLVISGTKAHRNDPWDVIIDEVKSPIKGVRADLDSTALAAIQNCIEADYDLSEELEEDQE